MNHRFKRIVEAWACLVRINETDDRQAVDDACDAFMARKEEEDGRATRVWKRCPDSPGWAGCHPASDKFDVSDREQLDFAKLTGVAFSCG